MAVPIFHVNEGACAAVFACSGEGHQAGFDLPLRSLPEYPDYLHIFFNKPFLEEGAYPGTQEYGCY